jgi:hypothetical protein
VQGRREDYVEGQEEEEARHPVELGKLPLTHGTELGKRPESSERSCSARLAECSKIGSVCVFPEVGRTPSLAKECSTSFNHQ